MSTVTELESDVQRDPPPRATWRAAVSDIAAQATAKLPECLGRIDSAVKLVLAGDVELLADGRAKVFSQSNGVASYSIVNGHCDCRDFAQAPHGFCKHRLSAAIARRAAELVPSAPPADDAPWPEMAPVHEERPMAQ